MAANGRFRPNVANSILIWTAVTLSGIQVGATPAGEGSLLKAGEDYGVLLALLTVLFFFSGKRNEPHSRGRLVLMAAVGILLVAGVVCHFRIL